MVVACQLIVDAWKLRVRSRGRESKHGAALRAAAFVLAFVPVFAVSISGQAGYADGSPYCFIADTEPSKRIISRSWGAVRRARVLCVSPTRAGGFGVHDASRAAHVSHPFLDQVKPRACP